MEGNADMYETLGYFTAGVFFLWLGTSAVILCYDRQKNSRFSREVRLHDFIVDEILPQLKFGSEAYNFVNSRQARDEIVAAWTDFDAYEVSIAVDDNDVSTLVTVNFLGDSNNVIASKQLYYKVHRRNPGERLLHK